ncbi:MAG TPA: hypothetical protein VN886_09855 [Acidimicrobiales bacterium]|nr:hypothetical protein [Acidimicrobiales bacterium]
MLERYNSAPLVEVPPSVLELATRKAGSGEFPAISLVSQSATSNAYQVTIYGADSGSGSGVSSQSTSTLTISYDKQAGTASDQFGEASDDEECSTAVENLSLNAQALENAAHQAAADQEGSS